ncbi:MAG: Z1 domain-containing protein [Rhizobiaceae bacterium]|nr:Z1 domain-containing protein [Rhizobiaceae bacterium]
MDENILRQISAGIIEEIHALKLSIHSEDELREIVKGNALLALIPHTSEDLSHLEHLVSSQIVIMNDDGAAIVSKDTKPWLKGKREEGIEWRYWNRFRKHLKKNAGFPWPVINKIDDYTRDILDYCGDPMEDGSWKRSGLVVGHVQSGKTTNYSGLIAKGIDSGYKVFILFAGITNSLRAQTQERIEENIIGLSTKSDGIIGVGNIPPRLPIPTRLTSFSSDFDIHTRRAIGVDLDDEGIHIFILKKNVHTIKNLIKWIEKTHPLGRLSAPMMLIDDEADNASINTSKHPDRMTAINSGIRKVLERFNRAVYVGYTATPFANIFIDHEDDESLIKSAKVSGDLFPRNFIKSLGVPDNYVGAARLFGDESEHPNPLLHTVSVVDDYTDILPLKHKKEDASSLSSLPPSLEKAIQTFVLFCAVQKFRGNWGKHMTMMINVSRFNDVQSRVEDLVTEHLEELKNSAITGAGLGIQGLQSQSLLAGLKDIYEQGFFEGEIPYAETPECKGIDFVENIMPELNSVLKSIKPKTINMRTGGLVYDDNDPQKVIAIGGLALSRGLTLEGLSVSYLLRNASASDTLMQMARWFGYRLGYENLTRLFLPEVSLKHYKSVHQSIEELRDELRQMARVKKTPLEFGLKVRNSDTGIRITAANKSQSAARISFARNLENKHIQGYLLDTDELIRVKNLELSTQFINDLGSPIPEGSPKQNYAIWNAEGVDVLALIRKFDSPDSHPDFGRIISDASFVEDYISERLQNELENWDVVVPISGLSKEPPLTFCNGQLTVGLTRRHSCNQFKNNPTVFKTTEKDAVANPDDISLGLDRILLEERKSVNKREYGKTYASRETAALRGKPLLLVHLMDCSQSEPNTNKGQIDGFEGKHRIFASISILMPSTEIEPEAKEYTANKVLQQLGYDNEPDEDEDFDAISEMGAT